MSSQLEVQVRWHRACKTSFLAMVDISQHSWSSDHYYVSSSNPHINIIIVFCTRVLVVFLIFFSSEKRFKNHKMLQEPDGQSVLTVSPIGLAGCHQVWVVWQDGRCAATVLDDRPQTWNNCVMILDFSTLPSWSLSE